MQSRQRNEQTMASLLFGCCACICLSVILGLVIATLVKVNHLEGKIVVPTPAPTMVASAAAAALAGATNNAQSGLRNALLRHNIAGLKQDAVAPDAAAAADADADAQADPAAGNEQKAEAATGRKLSLAERIARAKQMSRRQK
jgi:hypothetical protein